MPSTTTGALDLAEHAEKLRAAARALVDAKSNLVALNRELYEATEQIDSVTPSLGVEAQMDIGRRAWGQLHDLGAGDTPNLSEEATAERIAEDIGELADLIDYFVMRAGA